MLRKKIFLVSNIQIETVYRLYCLQQLFQKRPNQAIFSAKKLHNGAVMKNLIKSTQKHDASKKKPFLVYEMQTETAYRLYFLEQLFD